MKSTLILIFKNATLKIFNSHLFFFMFEIVKTLKVAICVTVLRPSSLHLTFTVFNIKVVALPNPSTSIANCTFKKTIHSFRRFNCVMTSVNKKIKLQKTGQICRIQIYINVERD